MAKKDAKKSTKSPKSDKRPTRIAMPDAGSAKEAVDNLVRLGFVQAGKAQDAVAALAGSASHAGDSARNMLPASHGDVESLRAEIAALRKDVAALKPKPAPRAPHRCQARCGAHDDAPQTPATPAAAGTAAAPAPARAPRKPAAPRRRTTGGDTPAA